MACNFCDKKGLALLPVRPAIVRKEAGAPSLPSEIQPDVAERGIVSYTCRTLRAGYLYMWDEKRRAWTDYIVTDEGYFWCTGASAPAVEPPKGVKPCAGKLDEVAKASFITLPVSLDKANNGRFWFAWCDYPWTQSVRDELEKAENREAHMQCFDLAQWLESRVVPQALPLSRLRDTVVEYASPREWDKWFDFISAPWLPREEEAAQYLIETAVSVSSRPPLRSDPTLPAILAIPDSTGVARDLAQLLTQSTDESLEYCRASELFEDFDRDLKLHTMIETMKYSVKENAKANIAQDSKRREEQLEGGLVTDIFGGTRYVPMTEKTRRVLSDMARESTNKNFDRWSDEAWDRYQEYYKTAEQEKFKTNYQQALSEFYKIHTEALIAMYLEQLQHHNFTNFFASNFDTTDIKGGVHYSLTLGLCLLGGQKEGPCFDYYLKRLQGDLDDPQNPFLRAWVLNQKELSRIIKTSAPAQVAMTHVHELPWNAMIGAYASYLGSLAEKTELLNTLSIPLTGVLLSMMGKVPEDGVSRFIVLLAVRTEAPIAYFERQGTRRRLSENLSRMLLNQLFDGEGLSPAKQIEAKQRFARQMAARPTTKEMITLLETEMRQKEANGINLQGEAKQGYLGLLVDEMDESLRGKNVDERLAWAKTRAMTGDMADDFMMKRSLNKASQAGNVVSLLFQLAAVGLMVKQEQSWYGGIKTPAQQRLTATWAGIAGSSLETAAGVIKFRIMRGMRAVRPWVNVISHLGRGLGIAASGFIAGLDMMEGRKQWNLGHTTLAILYLTSAGLGLLGIVCIFAGLPILGLILAVVVLGVAYLIEYYKPNDLQKWLSRTQWGVHDPDSKDLPFITGVQEEDNFNNLWQLT